MSVTLCHEGSVTSQEQCKMEGDIDNPQELWDIAVHVHRIGTFEREKSHE